MLDGTTLGLTRGFGLIVHHADGEREYAYERYPNYGAELDVALDEAKGWNWVIVDMAEDWKAVFTNSKDKDARMFDAIVGPTWTLMSIDGLSVVDQSNANMIFGVGGKVAGNTGVNRFSGTVEVCGNRIALGPLATTRRAGPPALMAQESSFLKAMSDVVAMKFAIDGTLDLVNANDKTILAFAANRGGANK